MYLDTNNKNECCGCFACYNACPQGAIEMREDNEGFLYPYINEEICIQCNVCRKVCCWDNPSFQHDSSPIVLASVLKDKEERQRSTSGGIFYSISKWVINKGGVVFGASFDVNFKLIHFGAQTIDELQRLRGSKYIQSNVGAIYKEVKRYLDLGRWCYFTGTGCQVAGLKAFLKRDYDKLVTSDIVCHGVPSQKLFDYHRSFMEKRYHDVLTGYQFRDLKIGKGGETCFFKNREPIVKPTYEWSPYLYGFMYGLTLRHSCYECRFSTVPRQGDITLGDYWGAEVIVPQIDSSNGVSLLLINSEKGREVWDCIKDDLFYYPSTVTDAEKFNGNLTQPIAKPEVRDSIYRLVDTKGYSFVARKYFRSRKFWKVFIYGHIESNRVLRSIYRFFNELVKLV